MNSFHHLSRRSRLTINLGDMFDIFVVVAGSVFLSYCMMKLYASKHDMFGANILLGLNGALSLVGLFVALRFRYPILFIIFYFDFIFFSIAPLQQILAGFDPILEYDQYLFPGIIQCLLFSILALGATFLRSRQNQKPASLRGLLSRSIIEPRHFQPYALFIATSFVIMALLLFYGTILITSREDFGQFLEARLDKGAGLLLTSFFNPFVVVAAVIGLRAAQQSRSSFWMVLFGVLLIAALFIVNPLVTARFRLSAVLLFGLLVFVGWNNTRIIALSVIAGLLISPLLNSFRTDQPTSDIRDFDTFFAHMDYEGLTIMCHTIYYVGQVGYSYGSNIISALLFFIPRPLWPDKSEHVTYYLFPYLQLYRGLSSDNLSSPVPSEGYFAFGIVGTIVFTMAVLKALITIERRADTSEEDSPWRLIACISPMLTMILLRGPFLVGYSEFWGYVLAIIAATLLLRIRIIEPFRGRRSQTLPLG
jgi:hypothetical protein